MKRTVETSAAYWNHRHVPAPVVAYFADQCQKSGVVDYIHTAEVLTNWWPRWAWQESVPSAETILPDCDSLYNGYMALAMASMVAPQMGLMIGTTAIRSGPAENFQSMLTLASCTEGRAICQLGVGEAYNAIPFGYKLSEGLARLEDHFQLYKLLWERDEPFDFEGKIWKYERAYCGAIRPERRPLFYGMGAGPRNLDLIAKYADGWMTLIPGAYSTPEEYAAAVKDMKERVEKQGRDPEEFGFCVVAAMMIHEDREVIERGFDNPVVRWFSATIGRLNQAAWEREGLEPVFPDGWHYSLQMLPTSVSREDFNSVVERFDRRYMEKSYFTGSPKEVAAALQEYVDAGVTLFRPTDPLPNALPPEGTAESFENLLEVYRILKGK